MQALHNACGVLQAPVFVSSDVSKDKQGLSWLYAVAIVCCLALAIYRGEAARFMTHMARDLAAHLPLGSRGEDADS